MKKPGTICFAGREEVVQGKTGVYQNEMEYLLPKFVSTTKIMCFT